ncbi:MAG: SAM-dependent chlorinase/fluorinase [Atribacterota bacterium]
MSCVVLLTDWGHQSYYVGVVKGVISKINPHVTVIDLTHEIEPYNVREAMHILARAYRDFPSKSIFMGVVDSGVGTERKAIAIETSSGYFLVGPDNGMFTLIAIEDGVKKVIELSNSTYFYTPNPSSTFHGRDIFAPVSAHLSSGVALEMLGVPLEKPVLLSCARAELCRDTIRGEVLFFDRFGNIETNIPAHLAEKASFAGSEVTLVLGQKTYLLRYTSTYGTEPRGTLTIHPDSSGFLEIAVTQGNARQLLQAQAGMEIMLRKAFQKPSPEQDKPL